MSVEFSESVSFLGKICARVKNKVGCIGDVTKASSLKRMTVTGEGYAKFIMILTQFFSAIIESKHAMEGGDFIARVGGTHNL